jgi:ABC-type transport system involved in cytochrome bd biosynthesis fused ATPase/permease subunit
MMKGKTTISITHRLESTESCDSIHVLNHGTIEENGCYRDLLEKKGTFYTIIHSSPE